MNGISVLDEFLLGICTNISHKFQLLTGRTNFFIAKMGVFLSSVMTILRIANYFHQVLYVKTSAFDVVMYLAINALLFKEAVYCDKADESAQSSEVRLLPAFLIARREKSPIWRIAWVVLAVLDTGFGLELVFNHNRGIVDMLDTTCFIYGVVIFYYFVAVDPLPPGKSKIRQWFEKFSFGFLKPVPQGAEN